MELGWTAVLQGILIALSTWYVRRGSHEDARKVVVSTAAQSTSNDILDRVKKLETQLKLVQERLPATIDHRGPSEQKVNKE